MTRLAGDERFRIFVDGIRDFAIILLDTGGWITTWNEGAKQLKGYAPEEIIGRHFSVFYTEDDNARERPTLELNVAAASGRFEDEGWRVRKDGSRFWAHVVITALRTGAGELIGFAKITHDLTSRRQEEVTLRRSEARLAGIIASAMDAIISINDDQRIVLFNRAAEKMFRCTESEALGRPLDTFLPERFRRVHIEHVRAFGQTGVTSRSMSRPGMLLGLRANGEEFPIEATISQIQTDGQKIFTVILRDVSERVESEHRVQDALDQANAANRAKTEFLAMMSHELRTPLNAIAGYAQILELGIHGPVSDIQGEQLRRIQQNGRHLMTVIDNILNFARVDAGQLEYNVRDVPVLEAITEVSSLIQGQMDARRLSFTCEWPDSALMVKADADKLRQVLLNLLTNAAKFTEPGGWVHVRAEPADDVVYIHVQDSGAGIAAEKLDAIFEPFVQLERTLTNAVQGTGLGLAISRKLARAMGGELTVESTPSVGSNFTLRLKRTLAPR